MMNSKILQIIMGCVIGNLIMTHCEKNQLEVNAQAKQKTIDSLIIVIKYKQPKP